MTRIIESKVLISALFVAILCVILSVAIAQPTSAEELTPTASGSCGASATWEYYASTGELKILGSGSMTNYYPYNSSTPPWYSYRSNIKSVSIASGITLIGVGAFRNCYNLTSVTFDEGSRLTEINGNSFYNCQSLVNMKIPSSVTGIYNNAFWGCDKLMENENGVLYVDRWAVGCDVSVVNTSIRENTVGISAYTFRDCSELISIEIPTSVTRIASPAFVGCSSLETIVVDEGNAVYHSVGNCIIETKKKRLIVGCKNTVIPTDGSVALIDFGTFHDCYGLTSIEIPSSVKGIYRSFLGCADLKSITLFSDVPVRLYGMDAFANSPIEAIYVPASAVEAYKSHKDWAEYKDIVFPIENSDTPEIKYGDVNGDGEIGASDVLVLRMYMASYDFITGTSNVIVGQGADANGDGTVNALDVLILRKYMASYDYTTGSSSVVLGPQS